MLDFYIKQLVDYGVSSGLIPENERVYSTNLLLEIYGKDNFSDPDISETSLPLDEILNNLLDIAVDEGLIEDSVTYRDLFDTKLMNCITPRPSQLQNRFWFLYETSPKEATDFYYDFSQNTNYIRRDRIAKDLKWKVPSEYGDIDITINLSKPEKDPKLIAAAKNAPSSGYPKCLLCRENEGYAGNTNHPARQNHRIIPLRLGNSDWNMQYSPYVYYNEHCIVFNNRHTPMKIDTSTFVKLFDFVKMFPHYFIGSNADLPIVGGSILSHDHFQGGHYTFAMAKAKSVFSFEVPEFNNVSCEVLKWPLSVIRLKSDSTEDIVRLASHILVKWRNYTDEDAFIFANTDGKPHNTITPIARFRDGMYELDLALRNNITTPEHPLGVYHPHEKLHHIKKENIGLIEVMGLAVLPSRLKNEMNLLAEYIIKGKDISGNEAIAKHADWANEILSTRHDITSENVMEVLETEIGKVFVKVLEDAGVYKCTPEGLESFKKFIDIL
ncbi:UDP-glucose--hexose-1-phosphate uridylyltransferase [uncultured Eubacterium sp.]|uniref:UDP-glucose--hexose-1-phosphate uridylyltransferase n=1 Tax=uncultured Eubacterium sp. TaxID=165185 RepID=UPI0026357184|nr:UDP-glucose--hexose-1-phosphate uridylyltransferase [uncultured Eubacterium sp.]